MKLLTHRIGLYNLNSLEETMNTLNSISDIKCTIIEKSITSVLLSIEINDDDTLDDVLAIGVLIGSIQTSLL
jgi:hypothetical protein